MFGTHFPDKALAVVPASAWLKQAHYLPKYLHSDYGRTDPYVRSVLERTLSEYDAEMYAPNLKGVPLMVRMGSADETVPPLFNRRMARMVNEENAQADWTAINEVPGKGHWFDGVVD